MIGKKITNKEFNSFKTLLAGGLTINQIAETLHRSHHTIRIADESESFDEFTNAMAEYSKAVRLKYKKQPTLPELARIQSEPMSRELASQVVIALSNIGINLSIVPEK